MNLHRGSDCYCYIAAEQSDVVLRLNWMIFNTRMKGLCIHYLRQIGKPTGSFQDFIQGLENTKSREWAESWERE